MKGRKFRNNQTDDFPFFKSGFEQKSIFVRGLSVLCCVGVLIWMRRVSGFSV